MKESGRAREKLQVVVDTNVFVAAIFWQGSARECLVRFARRQFQACVTEVVLEEYAETAWDVKFEEHLPQSPQPWLNWISNRSVILSAVTLAEPVSADPDDDKFIECALAANADLSSPVTDTSFGWRNPSE
ncbi:MAG: putative toxin-antitoxin system toxin component, PIN family [Verrucomicrobia subdivision 3 bacterium]|nr:putative toxin-antitoxin system toxin component, PIN family [Limisphaerales bacterium]